MRKDGEIKVPLWERFISRLYLWYSFETTYMLGKTKTTPIGLMFFHIGSTFLIFFILLFPSVVRNCTDGFLFYSLVSLLVAVFVSEVVFRIRFSSEKEMTFFLNHAGDNYVKKIERLKSDTHPLVVEFICILHVLMKIFLFLLFFFKVVGVL